MSASPIVILTRPIGAASRLAATFSRLGCQTLVCPTLSTETLSTTAIDLASLDDADLIFFVSGAAVRAFAEQLQAQGRHLQTNVLMAAVGLSTASEITRVLGRTDVILPEPNAPEDSESLWRTLQARGEFPRHVLIIRGQSGRDWFADQLRQHGIRVSIHAAYCRTQATWDDDLVSQLRRFVASGCVPVIVCTSEEGILALVRLAKQHDLYSWCVNGRFVVTHARHQEVLVEQFQLGALQKSRQIFLSGIQDDAILDAVQSVCKSISCN